MKAFFGRGLIGALALFMALGSLGGIAYAGNDEDKDFSLRFPAALSRFSSYADVAAVGGASAGSKWQTSVNPASIAWQRLEGTYKASLNPQYSAIRFQEGTVLHVLTGSVTKDMEKYGTLQVAVAQVRSNDDQMRNGLRFAYEMNYLQAQYGKKLTDNFALGAGFNLSSAEVENKFGVLKLADSKSETYGIRVGALYRIVGNLLGGVVVDYSSTPSTTSYYDGMTPIGFDVSDTTKQLGVRVGPSYEYMKDSTINLDYQYASFKNDTGKLEVHRVYAGIDHRIMDALFVRGGIAVDRHGDLAWTCGVGIYPTKAISIDLGYQHNMFPEIEPEFGRSHMFVVSLGISF